MHVYQNKTVLYELSKYNVRIVADRFPVKFVNGQKQYAMKVCEKL